MLPFGLFKVTGESMLPGLRSGDYVFIRRRPPSLLTGDLVVVQHTQFGTIIKRIKHVCSNNQFTLEGDNPLASTSSAALGLVSKEQVLGKVVWQIKRPR